MSGKRRFLVLGFVSLLLAIKERKVHGKDLMHALFCLNRPRTEVFLGAMNHDLVYVFPDSIVREKVWDGLRTVLRQAELDKRIVWSELDLYPKIADLNDLLKRHGYAELRLKGEYLWFPDVARDIKFLRMPLIVIGG